MVHIDPKTGEIRCKVVYYGPMASGKGTSIKYLYEHIDATRKSPITSRTTESIRIITCGFLLHTAEVPPAIRYFIFAVTGASLYAEERMELLDHVDGVIFVADAQKVKAQENQAYYTELLEGLRKYHINPIALPFVWQYNKQDIPQTHRLPTEVLNNQLNKAQHPYIESTAWKFPKHQSPWNTGDGVIATFSLLHKQIIARLQQQQNTNSMSDISAKTHQ